MKHPLYSKKLLHYFNVGSEINDEISSISSKPLFQGSSNLHEGEQIILWVQLSENDFIEKAFYKASGGVPIIGIAGWCVDVIIGKRLSQVDKSLSLKCKETLELSPAQWYCVEILLEAIEDLKNKRNFL